MAEAWRVRDSGLAVPSPPPEPPKQPDPLSLAFESEGDRRKARQALQLLHGLTDRGGCIMLPDRDMNPLRAKLIEQLAELLLGKPVEFEVKC